DPVGGYVFEVVGRNELADGDAVPAEAVDKRQARGAVEEGVGIGGAQKCYAWLLRPEERSGEVEVQGENGRADDEGENRLA
ncbi:hypothetical protein V493_08035, partial [Pseudogymnoascus sp. VKM F-4281 (FW-2241)]